MKKGSAIVALALSAAFARSLAACNRVQNTNSEQSARLAKPTPQSTQPVVAVSPAPAVPVHQSQSSVFTSNVPPTAVPASDQASPKMTASDHVETLVVAQHTFRLLTHMLTIDGPNEQTVEWWELRNADDRVVYRKSYNIAFQSRLFESTVAIHASAFNTDQGGGILIHGMDLPSAPGSGGWLQVFGYKYGHDKYGQDETLFGPFGPPIMVDGEFLDVSSDSLRPTPASFGGVTVTVMHDFLRFRLWTGNFHIVYPVLINWITGKLQPAALCPEMTSKGQVDRCTYPVSVEDAVRATQPTFVRLFPEADDGGSTPKHVIVQPQSKIEYLEARVPVGWNQDTESIYFSFDGDIWLKIRIDGLEGWIHTQEDFDAVGLPQSG